MRQVVRRRINRVIVFGITGTFLGLLAGYISSLWDNSPIKDAITISTVGAALGFILAVQIGLLEEFVWRKISKRMSFPVFSVMQFLTYLVLIIIWLIIAFSLEKVITDRMTFSSAIRSYLLEEDFARDVVISSIMAILLLFIGKLRMLHKTSDLFNLVIGRYYYPEPEERTIMFLDLVGSTGMAEKLGALEYSSFLQHIFYDVSESIQAWSGEVYQYLGDGMIISWVDRSTFQGGKVINCFYDIHDIVQERRHYYEKKFGVYPQFRAGVHLGEIITTWIGENKKELAFHGDAINSASRIQSLCREYNESLLVSEEFLKQTAIPPAFAAQKIGKVLPRGKSTELTLYAIHKS